MVEIAGQTYAVVRGSDVDRDGMYLELSKESDRNELAEVFYSDGTGEFSLSTLGNSVPLPAIEWLIEQARAMLPPAR